MTCNSPLAYLSRRGLTLTITNNKLIVKPTKLVTKEITDYIKAHIQTIKGELAQSQDNPTIPKLEDLTARQELWLTRIANILEVTPDYLLEHQLIDQYDLVELLDKDPLIVANGVKSSCYWIRYH